MNIEICANSYASALSAQRGGATRIELCSALELGGLTPSYGTILKVMEHIKLPVYVLIRPRSGNFSYSEDELDIILRDINFCKEAGCQGVVSGALHLAGSVDLPATEKMVKESEGMDFTFHRAFDWCTEPEKTLQQLQKLGVDRILSSGQQTTALEGMNLLQKMNKLAGNTIEIMPGSGINKDNILQFKNAGFTSVHLSASIADANVTHQKPLMHSPGLSKEVLNRTSSTSLISEIVQLIHST